MIKLNYNPISSCDTSTRTSTYASRTNSIVGEIRHIAKPHISDRNVSYQTTIRQLDFYYGIVKRKILRYQSPTSGLFPVASDNVHEASIRDSIYCAASIWSLFQAYKRIDDDHGKSYELGQSAVKCMRGILFCWLNQADLIEPFKKNQSPNVALHSKFNLVTGEPIVSTEHYGHLQIDIPSLYLIYLVQMITSGLQIIYSMDEVNFIQNLVYYVERAYRTTDFGIWERGSKYNNGTLEVTASSIGMAKAALEAVNGSNLFGERGTASSVIFVDIDAHNRNRSIFETILPRESSSRNTDVSLLPTISFPCFATHDDILYNKTKTKVVKKLKGEYGFKRFLRDGYGTVLEDPNRRYYHHGETKNFDNIECEWPIFYIYMIIDGVFKNFPDQVTEYHKLLHHRVLRDAYDDVIVPKYYYVPEDCVELEKRHPGSNIRIPSREGSQAGCIFLWAQSLYIISQLLVENLLHINELDPIRRYLPSYCRPRRSERYSAFQGTATDLVVQVVLIAESMRLQAMMATYGIQTQTPHEVEPIQIWSQSELVKAYGYLGVNKKLKLLGRPSRPIGHLGTSKTYRILGQTVLCYPLNFDSSDFYLSHDMSLLIDDVKNGLQFIGRYWKLSGRPTCCLLVREEHMRDVKFKEMIDFLSCLKNGKCESLQVHVGRIQNLLSSSCMEHLDFLPFNANLKFTPFKQLEHTSIGYQSLADIPKAVYYNEPRSDYSEFHKKSTPEIINFLREQDTLYGQSQLLGILYFRENPDFIVDDATVKDRLQNLNARAGILRNWQVVRYCSSILEKLVDSITPFLTAILVNGKQITIGVCGHEETLIDRPMNPIELKHHIYTTLQKYDVYQAVLQQEIILYMGIVISNNPQLFNGMLKVRIGWVIQAMKLYCKYMQPKLESLECLSPSTVRKLVIEVLMTSHTMNNDECTPLFRRKIEGALGRVPDDFYERVWQVLIKTPGGLIVAKRQLFQQPTISDMTMSELNFSLTVETMLNFINEPHQRQIMVELLIVLSTILQRNKEIIIDGCIDTDKLLAEAIELYQKDRPSDSEEKSDDSQGFYGAPPGVTTRYLARAAVNSILQGNGSVMSDVPFCTVS